jgi:tRNA-dihydrouridine synthase B
MNTFSISDKNCLPEIHLAPLQGYTDMAYISSYESCFEGVDYYYTPYFSVDEDLSGTNLKIHQKLLNKLIPQVLPANINELKQLMAFVMPYNFSTINLNLGCPYPMVTRKGRGAYLIQTGKTVSEFIDYIHDNFPLKVSIKTRLGLTNKTEIFNLLETIASKEIESVIIHPRTASQLYKGEVSVSIFQECKALFPNIDFIYNGDIVNLENFSEFQKLFINQHKWMIGRGILSNPLLACEIKGISFDDERERNNLLKKFIYKLIDEIENSSKDRGHALNRIKMQFNYLSNSFPVQKKIIRFVKKIKSESELIEFLMKEFDSLNNGLI